MTQEHSPLRGLRIESDYLKWPEVENNADLAIALKASIEAGKFLKNAYYGTYETHVQDDKSEFTPYDQQAEHLAIDIIRTLEPNAVIMSEEVAPNQDISGGDFWVADGIDGTTNFSRKIPICNFTLAKAESGIIKLGVVYDFLNGDIYYALKDKGAYKNGEKISVNEKPFSESVISFAPLRYWGRDKWDHEKEAVDAIRSAMDEVTDVSGRFHREFQSGGLELAWVSEGKLEGFASSWTSPWDLSAGVLLVQESGGIATNIYGEDWQPSFMGVIAGNQKVHPHLLFTIQKHFNG